MQRITLPQLWSFLHHQSDNYTSYLAASEGEAPETVLAEEQFSYLMTQDLKPILVDQYVSENHPGGEEFVSVVDDVLAAQREGYQVLTWYGPDAEVLITGIRPGAQTGWLAAAVAGSSPPSRSCA
jgi:hypothetical protein